MVKVAVNSVAMLATAHRLSTPDERSEAIATVEPYVNKIAYFDTAEEIREFLFEEGIKGVPSNAFKCVVAEYVKRGSGKQVNVGPLGVYDEELSGEVAGRALKLGVVTSAMQEFIFNFDDEEYPELVKW